MMTLERCVFGTALCDHCIIFSVFVIRLRMHICNSVRYLLILIRTIFSVCLVQCFVRFFLFLVSFAHLTNVTVT